MHYACNVRVSVVARDLARESAYVWNARYVVTVSKTFSYKAAVKRV